MKWDFLQTKKAFYIITAIAFVIAVIVEGEYYFAFDVVKTPQLLSSWNKTVGNTTTLVQEYYTFYNYSFSEFGNSGPCYWLEMATSLFRDFILVLVIIGLNILILIEIKKLTKARMALASDFGEREIVGYVAGATPHAAAQPTSKSVLAALRAERRKAKMIFFTGLNFMIGHLAWLVYSLALAVVPNFTSTYEFGCFWLTGDAFLYVSYATPFFFYYSFNTQFKKFANRTLKYAFYPLYLVLRIIVPSTNVEDTILGTTS
jgi:hypothetical protein